MRRVALALMAATAMTGCAADEAAAPQVQIRPVMAECAPAGTPVAAVPAVEADAAFRFDLDGAVLSCSTGPGIAVPQGSVSDAPPDPAITGEAPTVVLQLPDDAMVRFNTLAASCYQQDERCPAGQIVVTLGTEVVSIASVVVPEFEGDLQLAVADEATVQRVTDALAG